MRILIFFVLLLNIGFAQYDITPIEEVYHAYGGFQDSASTINLTQNVLSQVTNSGNDLFIGIEADGFIMSGDTMQSLVSGDIDGAVGITLSGSNTNEYQFRIRDITQDKVMGFDMGVSTSTGTYIGARWTGDVCFWNLINYYKNTQSATKTKGILAVNTAGDNSMSYYVNDSIIQTNTASRTSVFSDNLAFFVGCDNASGTPTYYTRREYMGWFFGKEMTATQYRGFVNCIKAYFLRKGKTI